MKRGLTISGAWCECGGREGGGLGLGRVAVEAGDGGGGAGGGGGGGEGGAVRRGHVAAGEQADRGGGRGDLAMQGVRRLSHSWTTNAN